MDEGKMRMHLLLQQLELTEDSYVKHFEHASIDRLTVHKKNRQWDFQIQLQAILPIDVFTIFQTRLIEKFSGIANILLTIQSEGKDVSQELINQYWPLVLKELSDMAPPLKERLLKQQPEWNGQMIHLTCGQEIELRTFKKKYIEQLSDVYVGFGFPKIAFDFRLVEDTEAIAKAQLEFLEQRRLEEEKLGQKALEDMQKRDQNRQENGDQIADGPFQLGVPLKKDEPIIDIKTIQDEERRVTIEGFVFDVEVKELRSGRSLLTAKVTDYTDSILVKMFSRDKEDAQMMERLQKGMWIKVRGSVQNDTFVRDLIIMAQDMNEINPMVRMDTAKEKRVELHLHTPMSQMDAVSSVSSLVSQAAKWGHKAIAITDHANLQSFPEAYAAGKKNGIKILYGLEANLVHDGVPIAYDEQHTALEDAIYIVFDVETTGLSATYDKIIELAAVKMQNGNIIDKFERFVNPHHALSATTIELTGITDDMVRNAPEIEQVIKDFYEFIGDGIIVAHNASFDMGFLYEGYRRTGIDHFNHPVIDTLELARFCIQR